MSKQARFAWIAIFLFALIATGIKAYMNNHPMKPGDLPPSSSSAEAKNSGIWVCDYSVEPTSFEIDGKVLRLGEAWVEEAVAYDYLVWFRRRIGWNRLCLRIPRRHDGAVDPELSQEQFSTLYAGPDFTYVMRLEPGVFATLKRNVEFWQWEPEKKTKLGTIVLAPKTS
jgi:hypothetical protein